MSRGGLLVLIVLLAAAIAVLVWLDRTAPPPPSADPGEPLVKAFAKDTVNEIDLACDGPAVTLVRGASGGWRITKPIDAEANLRRVDALLASLHDARVKKVIGRDLTHLESFGLSPAACTVRLAFASAAPAVTLRIGRSSPVGSERYAAGDDARVVLTDGNLLGAVAREASALREKRLFPVDPEAITRIALDRPDGPLIVALSGGVWRLEAPSPDAASRSACEELARAVATIELVDPDAVAVPVDVKPARRLRLEVATGANDPKRVGFVAAAGINGKRLGWRDGAARAGLIDESALGNLTRPPESFRDLRIASFSTPDVLRLTIERAGTTLRIARAGEGSPWSGSSGAGNFVVDGHRVDDLLERMRSLTAAGVAPGPPNSAATATLVIEGAAGALASVTWGPVGSDLWVTTPTRPGVVFQVDAKGFGPVPTQAADWAQSTGPAPKAGSGS